MTDTNPTAAEQTAETTDQPTLEQLLTADLQVSQESSEPEEETEDTEESEDQAEQAETDESEEAEEDAEGVDFGSLSDDELADHLASMSEERLLEIMQSKGVQSGLLKRISKLTKRAKTAEERLAQQSAQAPPVDPIENNPFSGLKSLDEVKAKRKELEGVLEATDALLDEHEDAGNDDLINYQGAEFTKRQLKNAQRNARKGLDKLLPAQEATIRHTMELSKAEAAFSAMVENEFPEYAEEGELGSQYKAMLADPRVEKVRSAVPDIGPQLPYLLAHALRSMSGRKAPKAKVTPTGGAAPKIKPPISPGGVGAPTAQRVPENQQRNALKKQAESGDKAAAISFLGSL